MWRMLSVEKIVCRWNVSTNHINSDYTKRKKHEALLEHLSADWKKSKKVRMKFRNQSLWKFIQSLPPYAQQTTSRTEWLKWHTSAILMVCCALTTTAALSTGESRLSFIMSFTSRLSSAFNDILGMTWFYAAEPLQGPDRCSGSAVCICLHAGAVAVPQVALSHTWEKRSFIHLLNSCV